MNWNTAKKKTKHHKERYANDRLAIARKANRPTLPLWELPKQDRLKVMSLTERSSATQFQVPVNISLPPKNNGFIADDLYKQILSESIINCVDIIVIWPDLLGVERALLITRDEAPLKDTQWMVGGRAPRSPQLPSLNHAALWKLKDEIGIIPQAIDSLYCLGVGETRFKDRATVNTTFAAVLRSRADAPPLRLTSVRQPNWGTKEEILSQIGDSGYLSSFIKAALS